MMLFYRLSKMPYFNKLNLNKPNKKRTRDEEEKRKRNDMRGAFAVVRHMWMDHHTMSSTHRDRRWSGRCDRTRCDQSRVGKGIINLFKFKVTEKVSINVKMDMTDIKKNKIKALNL